MVERTYLHGLWRASQAAHKSHATSDHPSAPLDRIPPMHKVSTPCTMLLFTHCSSSDSCEARVIVGAVVTVGTV